MRFKSGKNFFDISVLALQIIVWCSLIFTFFSVYATDKDFQVYEQVAREIYEFDGTNLYENPKGLYINRISDMSSGFCSYVAFKFCLGYYGKSFTADEYVCRWTSA